MKIKYDSVNAVRKWRKNMKQKLVTAMGGECVCCRYNKCNEALELHHIDPTQKELSFGKVTANPAKWDVIMAEAKKCALVCSNCHKEIHNGVTELPDTLPSFIEPDKIQFKKDTQDKCPVCGCMKNVIRKTCSRKCAGSIRNIYDWDDFNLPKLFSDGGTLSSIGRLIGCSPNTVKKRAKILNII